jgi:hypothetical protein
MASVSAKASSARFVAAYSAVSRCTGPPSDSGPEQQPTLPALSHLREDRSGDADSPGGVLGEEAFDLADRLASTAAAKMLPAFE